MCASASFIRALRRKPPNVKTGKELTNWYWKYYVKPILLEGGILVLCCDSYINTPAHKSGANKKIPSAGMPPPDAGSVHLFSDLGQLPDRWYAAQSGKKKLALLEYLIRDIQRRCLAWKADGAVYVHCPFSINSHYGTDLLSNQMICLKGDPELLSHTCEHGEAEMRALFWAEQLFQYRQGRVIVRCFDHDALAASLFRGGISPNLKLHLGKEGSNMIFANPHHICTEAEMNGINPTRIAEAMIASGTDFFPGIGRIGGGKLMEYIMKTPSRKPFIREDMNTELSQIGNVKVDYIPIQQMLWNAQYWKEARKVPAPIKKLLKPVWKKRTKKGKGIYRKG